MDSIPKKEAHAAPYAFPGTDAGKVLYTSGLPWPKGLQSGTIDDETSTLPLSVLTVAPSEFDHLRTKAPQEPAVPLPNNAGTSWKRIKIHSILGKRVKDTNDTSPSLDPDTVVRRIRFGEAYKAPVPTGFRRLTPAGSKKRVVKDPFESNLKKRVISVFGSSAVTSNTPTSRARAKSVSLMSSSAGKIERLIHGSGAKVVSAFEASGEGTRRLAIGAERKLHRPISTIHTRIAKADNRATPTHQEYHTFVARNGFKMRLRIHRGLASGEVEYPIRGHDWTKYFDCVLSLSQYSWVTGSKITAALYFNNLPARLKTGVPWNRPSLTQRVAEDIYHEVTCECCTERSWVSQTHWRDRSPQPQFAAVITVGHLTRFEALKHNPFEIMGRARNDKYVDSKEWLHLLIPLYLLFYSLYLKGLANQLWLELRWIYVRDLDGTGKSCRTSTDQSMKTTWTTPVVRIILHLRGRRALWRTLRSFLVVCTSLE